MIKIITYLYLIFIIIGWIVSFSKSKTNGVLFLVYSSIIYVTFFSTFNIDFIIKILLLINNIFAFIDYRFKKNIKGMLLLLIFLFCIGLMGAKFSSTYSIMDNLSAYITTANGFMILGINWPKESIEDAIKKMSYISIISVVAGILLIPTHLIPFFSRNGGVGLGGASLATNLSFFGVASIIASLYYYYRSDNEKYRYIAYVNFFIVVMTLTRGGILAGLVALFPDIISWLKESLKYKKKFFLTIIIGIISIIPIVYFYNMLIARTFVNGELNTSGRLDAWNYIISLVRNKYYGNGLGNLKTLTDSALRSFTAAHNEYVRIYYETGLIGTLLYFILFVKSFKGNFNTIKLKKMNYVFFILSFILYSVTDNTITNYRFWIPFVFIISLIGCDYNEKNRKININS